MTQLQETSQRPTPDRIEPPWSDEQVAALNLFQDSGVFHPYTSENGIQLIATKDGWVEERGGPVVQTWAHGFSAEEKRIKDRMALLSGMSGNLPPSPKAEDPERIV